MTDPKLLAALKGAESLIDAVWANTHARSEYGWGKEDDATLAQVRAAIAEAEAEDAAEAALRAKGCYYPNCDCGIQGCGK